MALPKPSPLVISLQLLVLLCVTVLGHNEPEPPSWAELGPQLITPSYPGPILLLTPPPPKPLNFHHKTAQPPVQLPPGKPVPVQTQPPSHLPVVKPLPPSQVPVKPQPPSQAPVVKPQPPVQAPVVKPLPPVQAPAVKPVPKRSLVAVQGVVYCKPCKFSGYDTLLGATPLVGANVELHCNNTKFPKVQLTKTDKNGYFFMLAQNTLTTFGAHKCNVKLGSSNDPKCSKPTNLHYGLQGSKLLPQKQPNLPKALPYQLYSVGPFAYEPAIKCAP